MQTAVGVFGGENYSNGVSAPPLMVENAADSGRPAISSLNCPPFLAVEACRERLVCTFSLKNTDRITKQTHSKLNIYTCYMHVSC